MNNSVSNEVNAESIGHSLPASTEEGTSTTTPTDMAVRETTTTTNISSTEDFFLTDGVIRAIFLLLGVGILIPWNAFVSAKPYFSQRLCNESTGQDIVNFEQYFGLVWNIFSIASLGLIILSQTISDYCKNRRSALLVNVHDTTYDGETRNPLQQHQQERTSMPTTDDDGCSNSSRSSHSHDHSFALVMVPLTLYMAVFSVQATLVLIPHISPRHFLSITLIGLGICGTCGAIATAGIVSTAGLFPSHIGINPFFSGQALGGVAVSLANFVAATVEDPDIYYKQHCNATNRMDRNNIDINHFYELVSTSTQTKIIRGMYDNLQEDGPDDSCSSYESLDYAVFSYFFAGCIVLLLCLVGYHWIHQYQKMQHRDDYEVVDDNPLSESISTREVDEISPRIGLELNDRLNQRQSDDVLTAPSSVLPTDKISSNSVSSHPSLMCGNASNLYHNDDGDEINNDLQRESFDEEYTDEVDEGAVFSAIKGPTTCIFLTFTVTLCLFPSWISELRSNHECQSRFRLYNDLHVPFTFVFFNVGDLIGRILAERVPVQHIRHLSKKLVFAALLRVAFFPLFLMCLTTTGSESKIVIRSDIYSLLVQFFFAVSNGLLVSTAFMWSPHLVGHTTELQERASEMMTFSVFLGLLSGSMLAFPFLQFASEILH